MDKLLKTRSSGGIVALVVLFAAVLSFGRLAVAAEDIDYRVQPGDTLIGLGERMLVSPEDWRKIQLANKVKDPYRIPVGTVLRIPVSLLQPQPLSAQVVTVSGDAVVDGQPVKAGMQVGSGARIATGDTGYVTLQLPDGSLMTLPARSAARVDTLQQYSGIEGQDFGFQLEHGRIESHVMPQRGPAARYRVDTPTAVIGVRGTDFRVGYDPLRRTSRAETTQGAVSVAQAAEKRSAKGKALVLPAGFGMVAQAGGVLSSTALLPAPDLTGMPELFERPLVRLSLPVVAGADALRVQVVGNDGDNSEGASHKASVLYDELVNVSLGKTRGEVRIPNLQDGNYRLRVRAVAPNGLEGYDAERAFRLLARPEPPFLSTPEAGKTRAGKVQFSWTESAKTGNYLLEVATDAQFQAPLVFQGAQNRPSMQLDLTPGQYFWRVASMRDDDSHGPFSDTVQFETRPVPELGEDALELDAVSLKLRWTGEEGQRFEYQFASDMQFKNLLAEGQTEDPMLTLPLPPPDTYWIRIRATDPDGYVGQWGSPQKTVISSTVPWWMFLPVLLVL